MKELSIKPEILRYNTAKEFIDDFKLDENDLIIASEIVFKLYFEKYDLRCQILADSAYEKGEPTDDLVELIHGKIKGNPKRVIAIGGGSILDIAKLLALKNIIPVSWLFDKAIEPVKDKELVCIPTTCGTGSEITNISILSLLKKGTKKGLQVNELFPDYAVLIPELLGGLPEKIFGTSSIDALIHCVESALSPKATATTKIFSYKGIEMILKSYMKIAAGDSNTRVSLYPDLLLAATYGGIAFGNAGTGAVHAMSYPFGAKYHVPHGESNYVLFIAVLKYYISVKAEGEIMFMNKFIADIIGSDVSNVYDSLENLLDHIVKKKPLHEYGVSQDELKEFAKSCYENQQRLLGNNFVPFNEEIILSIYESVY